MKKSLLIAACLLLAACGQGPGTLVSERVANYKIVEVDPPKRVRVTVKDLMTGERHEISLGKHFSNWREHLIVGRKVELTSRVLERKDGSRYTNFVNAYTVFGK